MCIYYQKTSPHENFLFKFKLKKIKNKIEAPMLNPTEIHLFIYMAKSYRILSLFFPFLNAFFFN